MEQIGAGRRIVRRNPHRIVGTISFPTLGNMHGEWESVLERDTYMTIAYCSDVIGINTQPLTFEYEDHAGRKATYTPDARVLLRDEGEVLLEVKPAIFALKDEEFRRLSWIKKQCNFHCIGFDVLTDVEIQANKVRLDNIRLLRTFFSAVKISGPMRLAASLLDVNGPLTINQLAEISNYALPIQTIFLLIAHRELSIDWNIPLTVLSKVWLPQKNSPNLSYGQLIAEAETNSLVGASALDCGKEIQRIMALEKACRRPVLPAIAWGIG